MTGTAPQFASTDKTRVQMEGRRAFSDGRGKDNNPYDSVREKLQHVYWNSGWTAAKAGSREAR